MNFHMSALQPVLKKTALLAVLLVFVSSVSLFADGYYVGKGMSDKRLAVFDPQFKGLGAADEAALVDLVNIVRMDLHDYAGFIIVDAQNREKIQNLQAASEDDVYDTGSTLRPGLLQFAEYEAFITVTRSGGKYSLSLSITDLSTGNVQAEHTVTKITSAGEVTESGVTRLIDAIVPKLGIELTAMGRYVLSGGDASNLSTKEQAAFTRQETENLQKTLSELDAQLKTYGGSAQLDLTAVAIKAQLETDRQLTEQKLLMAQQKAARLEQQSEKEMLDALAAADRSAKANEMIASLSDQVEKAAVQIRNKEFESMSIMQQISVIEKEKKAYIELRGKIENEVEKLHLATNAEYRENWKDPDDVKNYTAREIDAATGKPFDSAKESVRVENQNLKDRLEAEEAANVAIISEKSSKQLKDIADDIAAKEKNLSKKQTLNSLTTEGLLNVGAWNLDAARWTATVNISLNGYFNYTDTIFIDFNELCMAINKKTYSTTDMYGKNGRTPEYLEFLDTVDAFESLFRMGTPFVYLEADFTVQPLDKNSPSTYRLKAEQYRLYSTNDKKCIHTYTPDSTDSVVTFKPAYDMRSDKQVSTYENKVFKQDAASSVKKLDAGIYGFAGKGPESVWGTGLKIDIPLSSNTYVGFTYEATNDTDLYTAYRLIGSLGMYRILPVGSLPAVYAQVGLGFTGFDSACSTAKAFYPFLIPTIYFAILPLAAVIAQDDGAVVVSSTVGVDIPLGKIWGLFCQYDFSIDKYGFYDRYSVGFELMKR